jgi:GAF domain-containing protein/DNA-binding CsgD family transcriptional regulator
MFLGGRALKESPTRPDGRHPDGDLEARVRQQEAVAKLGMSALSGTGIADLLDEAVGLVGRTLGVGFVKVLELLPEGDALIVRAGAGWEEGVVGAARVGTNLESQAGYALISDGPVVCDDLHREVRFKGAALLHDHGIVSGVTAAILTGETHFGVLGAHAQEPRRFSPSDARFVQDAADVLGAAIARSTAEGRSRTALGRRAERTEAAEDRFRFLAGANALLSASSADYPTTLRNVARLAVPTIADWCFIDAVEEGARIHRAVSDRSGETSEAFYALDPRSPHGTARVLRDGRPEFVSEAHEDLLDSIAREDGPYGLPDLEGSGSFLCVPLRVRQKTFGTMGFIKVGPGRPYGPDDLALAEGLSHCAALAIENARHHVPELRLVRELLHGTGQSPNGPPVPHADAPDLTRRQHEVLNLLGEGRSARHIAAELHLSKATVRNHIRAVKHALDARSQLEAIARARKLGLLSD